MKARAGLWGCELVQWLNFPGTSESLSSQAASHGVSRISLLQWDEIGFSVALGKVVSAMH